MPNDGTIHCCGYCSALSCLSLGYASNQASDHLARRTHHAAYPTLPVTLPDLPSVLYGFRTDQCCSVTESSTRLSMPFTCGTNSTALFTA